MAYSVAQVKDGKIVSFLGNGANDEMLKSTIAESNIFNLKADARRAMASCQQMFDDLDFKVVRVEAEYRVVEDGMD